MSYARLLRAINERPESYAAGEVLFWNDPHISKGMLDAHLNPDLESASRKHEQINASARWISSLTSSNKKRRLLDLGCGPGLYAKAFLKQGFEVRGIDFSKRSIAYAQEHARIEGLNIEYCYENTADYLEQYIIIDKDACKCYHVWNHAFDKYEMASMMKAGVLMIFPFLVMWRALLLMTSAIRSV